MQFTLLPLRKKAGNEGSNLLQRWKGQVDPRPAGLQLVQAVERVQCANLQQEWRPSALPASREVGAGP